MQPWSRPSLWSISEPTTWNGSPARPTFNFSLFHYVISLSCQPGGVQHQCTINLQTFSLDFFGSITSPTLYLPLLFIWHIQSSLNNLPFFLKSNKGTTCSHNFTSNHCACPPWYKKGKRFCRAHFSTFSGLLMTPSMIHHSYRDSSKIGTKVWLMVSNSWSIPLWIKLTSC